MITLLLDVPVADEDILPWRLMCDYARSLAQRHGCPRRRRPTSGVARCVITAIDER